MKKTKKHRQSVGGNSRIKTRTVPVFFPVFFPVFPVLPVFQRSVICLLLVIVTCNQFVYSDEPQPYEREVFSEVVKFVRKKEYSSAKKELLKIKKDDLSRTGQWDYYGKLGHCEEKLENYDAAIRNYKKCIEIYYSEKMPYFSLYFTYTKIRDYESAFEIAQQIIEYFPEDERGYIFAASYYKEQAYDNEAAYQMLKEGIEAAGETNQLQLSLLHTYFRMERYESAFELADDMFKNKKKLDENSLSQLHKERAYYYFVKGMYSKADGQYKLALTDADKNYKKRVIYFMSSWTDAITGEYDKALEKLKSLDELVDGTTPLYAEASIAYAHLFYCTGDMDKAISYCETALARSKDFKFSLQCARAYSVIVNLYEHKRDFKKKNEYIKEGLKFVNEEIKKYPKSYEHKRYKANILINSDDKWNTAGALIDELMKERSNAAGYILKGLFEKKKGQLNEAVKWFEKARKSYPREYEAHALLNLSETHRELGQYDLALQNCKDALAINPNNRFAKDEIKLIEEAKKKK